MESKRVANIAIGILGSLWYGFFILWFLDTGGIYDGMIYNVLTIILYSIGLFYCFILIFKKVSNIPINIPLSRYDELDDFFQFYWVILAWVTYEITILVSFIVLTICRGVYSMTYFMADQILSLIAIIAFIILYTCPMTFHMYKYGSLKWESIKLKRREKRRKERERREKRLQEAHNLVTEGEEFLKEGNELLLEEPYLEVKSKWRAAIKSFKDAIEKAPSAEEKQKIETEQLNRFNDIIFDSFIKRAEEHKLITTKNCEEEEIQKTLKEWKATIDTFQKAKRILEFPNYAELNIIMGLKGDKMIIKENISHEGGVLKEIHPCFFIKKGLPAIVKENEVFLKPLFGLGQYLYSWYEAEKNKGTNLEKKMLKVLENFEDYMTYSKKILNFIHQEGRIPERDEVWELEIPIDETSLVLDLINVEIKENIFHDLALKEKKYYDQLSKPIVLSKETIEGFKLEELSSVFDLNLIDAKIIPKFIINTLNIDDLDKEIAKYLDIREFELGHRASQGYKSEKLENLNERATKILRLKLSRQGKLNLMEITRKLETSILEAGEAIYFVDHFDEVQYTLSDEEIEQLSPILSDSLSYCKNQDEDLSRNLLIKEFDTDFITANEIIWLYEKSFSLPEKLSRKQLNHLDEISKSVIKYIKEVKENPTIDDLMIDLNLNVRDANIIFPFINKITKESFQGNFDTYPEKVLLHIDDLSREILNTQDVKREKNLIDLSYQFNVGIYSIQQALAYINWIEEKVDDNYIRQLSEQKRKSISDKVKDALRYIKENDLELSFSVLIDEVGFSLKDTHLIIEYYNEIISKEVDIASFTESKKKHSEKVAREIYNAKKEGKIESFEPEEVLTLKINSTGIETLWNALNYLKIKVLNEIMGETRVIKTEMGRIDSEGAVKLQERRGTKVGKKEDIELSKKTIDLKDQKIKFKKTSEKVQIKRGMDFVGGLIRYKVAIKNNTEMLINDVEVTLKMTAEHIRIVDIKPRVYKKDDRAKIPSMSPEQSESIDFYLEPMICGSIPVAPMITYVDAFGKPKMNSREELKVVSKCPPIFNPKNENIAKVKHIYESDDIVKSFRSFELKHDAERSFKLLREAIGSWAGNQVSDPIYKSEDPFIAEAYYYVFNQNPDSDLGHKEQIIIRIQVDESKNVAILHLGAEKNPTVNGILTHVWHLANERFGEEYGYEFESLHCPECGAPLNSIKKKKMIRCEYCGEKFEKSVL